MTSLRDDFDQEYHSFGPWLIEIKATTDLPPQYKAIESVVLNATFCFKVPVIIDRRDAKPGMLLYSRIVCLTDDHLISFTQHKHTLRRVDIPFGNITYLRKSCDLLSNQLIIATINDIITIDYNAVSEDVINVALVHIRTHQLHLEEQAKVLGTVNLSDELSMMLINLLAIEPTTTPLTLIAHQPFDRIATIKPSIIRRLISIINPPVLQELALFMSPKELMIYTRHKPIKGLREVDYGYNFTYAPLANIAGITLQPSDHYKNINLISLQLNTHQFTLTSNKPDVTRNIKDFVDKTVHK